MNVKTILGLFSCAISLTSCFRDPNRKANYLFECDFATIQEGTKYTLKITKISEEAYLLADGKNVVKDVVKKAEHKFYAVCLSRFNEDGSESSLDFYNLKDPHQDIIKIPAYYDDDNGNHLAPIVNSVTPEQCRYSVQYDGTYLTIGGLNND